MLPKLAQNYAGTVAVLGAHATLDIYIYIYPAAHRAISRLDLSPSPLNPFPLGGVYPSPPLPGHPEIEDKPRLVSKKVTKSASKKGSQKKMPKKSQS